MATLKLTMNDGTDLEFPMEDDFDFRDFGRRVSAAKKRPASSFTLVSEDGQHRKVRVLDILFYRLSP
jgi:hypothetical protein